MKKILVVYYSLQGHTKKVAKALAKSLNADIEGIKDTKDRSNLVNWFVSASNEELRTPTKIKVPKKNPADYKLVVVGSPIWDGIVPAVKEYLKMNKSKFKKVAFFTTFSASAEDAFYQMQKLIHKKPIATLGIQDREIELRKYKDYVKRFCGEIKRKL